MFEIMVKVKQGMSYVLARLCTLLLVMMTLLVLWQVFSRYVLNAPSSFTEELVRYFLIWTGFIGAAYAFSTREHMALTFLRDKLPTDKIRLVTIIVDAIILIFALSILVVGGIKLAVAAKMEYSALLGIPRSLVYAMAPISGVFIIVAQIVNLYEDWTGKTLVQMEPCDADAAALASVQSDTQEDTPAVSSAASATKADTQATLATSADATSTSADTPAAKSDKEN